MARSSSSGTILPIDLVPDLTLGLNPMDTARLERAEAECHASVPDTAIAGSSKNDVTACNISACSNNDDAAADVVAPGNDQGDVEVSVEPVITETNYGFGATRVPPRLQYILKRGSEDVPNVPASRLLGHMEAAACGVVPTPLVVQWKVTERDSFVVLGNPALWQVMSSHQVVELVASLLKSGRVTGCSSSSGKGKGCSYSCADVLTLEAQERMKLCISTSSSSSSSQDDAVAVPGVSAIVVLLPGAVRLAEAGCSAEVGEAAVWEPVPRGCRCSAEATALRLLWAAEENAARNSGEQRPYGTPPVPAVPELLQLIASNPWQPWHYPFDTEVIAKVKPPQGLLAQQSTSSSSGSISGSGSRAEGDQQQWGETAVSSSSSLLKPVRQSSGSFHPASSYNLTRRLSQDIELSSSLLRFSSMSRGTLGEEEDVEATDGAAAATAAAGRPQSGGLGAVGSWEDQSQVLHKVRLSGPPELESMLYGSATDVCPATTVAKCLPLRTSWTGSGGLGVAGAGGRGLFKSSSWVPSSGLQNAPGASAAVNHGAGAGLGMYQGVASSTHLPLRRSISVNVAAVNHMLHHSAGGLCSPVSGELPKTGSMVGCRGQGRVLKARSYQALSALQAFGGSVDSAAVAVAAKGGGLAGTASLQEQQMLLGGQRSTGIGGSTSYGSTGLLRASRSSREGDGERGMGGRAEGLWGSGLSSERSSAEAGNLNASIDSSSTFVQSEIANSVSSAALAGFGNGMSLLERAEAADMGGSVPSAARNVSFLSSSSGKSSGGKSAEHLSAAAAAAAVEEVEGCHRGGLPRSMSNTFSPSCSQSSSYNSSSGMYPSLGDEDTFPNALTRAGGGATGSYAALNAAAAAPGAAPSGGSRANVSETTGMGLQGPADIAVAELVNTPFTLWEYQHPEDYDSGAIMSAPLPLAADACAAAPAAASQSLTVAEARAAEARVLTRSSTDSSSRIQQLAAGVQEMSGLPCGRVNEPEHGVHGGVRKGCGGGGLSRSNSSPCIRTTAYGLGTGLGLAAAADAAAAATGSPGDLLGGAVSNEQQKQQLGLKRKIIPRVVRALSRSKVETLRRQQQQHKQRLQHKQHQHQHQHPVHAKFAAPLGPKGGMGPRKCQSAHTLTIREEPLALAVAAAGEKRVRAGQNAYLNAAAAAAAAGVDSSSNNARQMSELHEVDTLTSSSSFSTVSSAAAAVPSASGAGASGAMMSSWSMPLLCPEGAMHGGVELGRALEGRIHGGSLRHSSMSLGSCGSLSGRQSLADSFCGMSPTTSGGIERQSSGGLGGSVEWGGVLSSEGGNGFGVVQGGSWGRSCSQGNLVDSSAGADPVVGSPVEVGPGSARGGGHSHNNSFSAWAAAATSPGSWVRSLGATAASVSGASGATNQQQQQELSNELQVDDLVYQRQQVLREELLNSRGSVELVSTESGTITKVHLSPKAASASPTAGAAAVAGASRRLDLNGSRSRDSPSGSNSNSSGWLVLYSRGNSLGSREGALGSSSSGSGSASTFASIGGSDYLQGVAVYEDMPSSAGALLVPASNNGSSNPMYSGSSSTGSSRGNHLSTDCNSGMGMSSFAVNPLGFRPSPGSRSSGLLGGSGGAFCALPPLHEGPEGCSPPSNQWVQCATAAAGIVGLSSAVKDTSGGSSASLGTPTSLGACHSEWSGSEKSLSLMGSYHSGVACAELAAAAGGGNVASAGSVTTTTAAAAGASGAAGSGSSIAAAGDGTSSSTCGYFDHRVMQEPVAVMERSNKEELSLKEHDKEMGVTGREEAESEEEGCGGVVVRHQSFEFRPPPLCTGDAKPLMFMI